MNITRTRAIAVLVAIRFKTADKWDLERIQKKLSGINETAVADDLKGIENKVVLGDLKEVLAANESKTAIVIEDDVKPAEGKGEKEKPAAGKGGGKTETPAAGKGEEKGKDKPKPAAKPAAEVDKLGNRVGSQAAKINAQLKKSYTSEEDIAKGANVTVARVRGHLKFLMTNKKAEHGEKGYRLV